MLRAFDLGTRWRTFSSMSWVDRLGRPLAFVAAAALLSRAQPLAGLAPFALALLAAGLAVGTQMCIRDRANPDRGLRACPCRARIRSRSCGRGA